MRAMLRERRTLASGIAAAFVCLATLSAQQKPSSAVPSGPGSISGLWQAGTTAMAGGRTLASGRTPERDRVIRTITGEWPPLQKWASDLLEERIAMSQRGDPYPTMTTQCLPGVPAMMLGGPYPIRILETPGQVTILLEEQNHFRQIYLNGRHPDDPDPTFLGHSVGRWEGDTLVVDTVGLSERTTLDRIGVPHSDALHLVERFRRTAQDSLELVITIDDPKAFTKSWATRVTYRTPPSDVQMIEYICENNRDYSGPAGK